MLKKLNLKSEFNRNVLTLASGTGIAQAIPIIATPILTRLYTPEDFGLLAIFISFISIFGTISCARYELAIMLPEKNEEAINIAALSFLIATAFSFFLFITILIFYNSINTLFVGGKLGQWLYLVPIVAWIFALHNILKNLNIRMKRYKKISYSTIYKSTAMTSVQILLSYFGFGKNGLLFGFSISHIIANIKLIKNIKQDYPINKIHVKTQKKLAKRYKKFPKYSLWASLANTSSSELINLLISKIFNVTTLGFYSLTQRVLDVPSVLISGAIGNVFFEQASNEKQKTGLAKKSFNKAFFLLLILGAIIFFPLYFFVEYIFVFVFGEAWKIAGEYATILIPLFFVRFVVSPLTMMNVIFEKNDIGMYWQFGLLFIQVFLISLAFMIDTSFVDYLNIMVPTVSFYYFILLMIIFNYHKAKD